ncbi:MAG: bifunctional precorrin-2 dehydrogenase/sirohydrochlorin ferrochelatase [Deltaproteobacteria bacterium]|nr:bifunctional precorrin-2 dehydrogenase/sirohydrochlorin ferrochelatase [Deltaproteobacteria bacterium]TLN03458.1 MAG: bifunctional precorrin-2 dehydrogenase/sirohydrochlorin ferrochelatase [bacterium]
MKYYPINIDIRGKLAIIVGGGAVAERKCQMLLEAGAVVTVIAPRLSKGLRCLLEKGSVSHRARDYRPGDLAGAFLVFAATGDRAISRAVAEEAAEWRILANIADMPDRSDFTTPAAVARGDLLLTVSTGGKCPVLAREVREELHARYGEEYGEVLRILGAVREKLLASKKGCHAMKEILHSLISHNLPGILRGESPDSVDRLLREIAGPGFSLSELGLEKRKSE